MTATNPSQKHRITQLIDSLKRKISNYTVKTDNGIVIGRVCDIRPSREGGVNLVLSSTQDEASSQLICINSQWVTRIDSATQSVFTNPDINPRSWNMSYISEDNQLEAETENEFNQKSEVVEQEIIRLLEEKLVIDRHKRKVGEVIVRKEIETRMVEVPVRREKLIIEEVGNPNRRLSEIDLGHGEVTGVEMRQVQSEGTGVQLPPISETQSGHSTVRGEFVSPKAASDLLEAIALQREHGCAKIRVEIELKDPKYRDTYQQMFDRCRRHR